MMLIYGPHTEQQGLANFLSSEILSAGSLGRKKVIEPSHYIFEWLRLTFFFILSQICISRP